MWISSKILEVNSILKKYGWCHSSDTDDVTKISKIKNNNWLVLVFLSSFHTDLR